MKSALKYLPLSVFALMCVGLAASNHLSDFADGSSLSKEQAAEVCSSTCRKFTECAAPGLPPQLSRSTFENGCYSGCMKHAETIHDCVSQGASSCEEIMKCSMDTHFQRREQ